MARNGKLIAVLGFWLGLSMRTFAQTIWADVTMDKSSVYVGEPVSVSVKVYTSTWFTTGLDLGNIKVQDAFSVYFRPVSISFQTDGKTYAGVEQIYNVFPYETGNVTFPVLDIEVESPAPGDFKGKKHTVKTKEKTINVKPAPASFASSEWLVAGGLSVSDHWNVAPKQVKVGDVLQRQISRTAYGTVSELIPPIAWDSLPGVSEYPSRSAVSNNKDKTSISASRTETMRYLFEKEGEVTIPEMVFTWYNPAHEKLYKRTLKAVTIQVEPNPDLGVLATVRDSLAMQQQEEIVAEETEEQPLTILGMSPEKFVVVVLLGILMLIILYKLLRRSIAWAKERRETYLISETFHFDQFKKAAHENDQKSISIKLYRWLDAMELKEPTATYFAKSYGSDDLQREVATIETNWGKGNQILNLHIREWESARKNYLNRGVVVEKAWINPV